MVEETTLRRLVIDRQRWARVAAGDGPGAVISPHGFSLLLNSDGAMCCLGWDCAVLGGASPDELRFKTRPLPLTRGSSEYQPRSSLDSAGIAKAVCINDRAGDHRDISNEEQEKRLTELFAKYGVELSFEN